ncbi:ABC transporter substrate-binding protein [Saccharomonospora saliphila]|uniref:ABC transporter substrate-binding protein n=1 Tax=Saccharomonospora saliphila TaxID=369829 RepID=UPI000368A9F4|nr:ABC transporter substrate-binding protein [Saccharomonospora saliphila]
MRKVGSRRRRRGSPQRVAALLGVTAVGASTLAACGAEDGKQINVYYAPEDNFQAVVDDCNEQAGGDYEIVYNKLPRDADGQREQMVRRLAAGDTSLDVLGLDVTWVPEFAEAGWVEEWTGENKAEASRDVLPGPLETATWDGKLYAAPKNTNVRLLWYDDRITPEPPRTWDEMMAMSRDLRERGEPHEILFTGAQYEGLVVSYNSITESAGGRILSPDGESVVIDEGARRALGILNEVSSSGLTDPSLTNQQEDEVRLAFQNGGGAFQLNWPFVYASYAEEKPDELEHFKWAPYPGVGEPGTGRSTIGGYNLAVSETSRHKQEAFEAALCLRSAEHQKFSALKDGVPPTIASVYDDTTPLDPSRPPDPEDNPTMATEYPMKDTIRDELTDAAVRPATPAYQTLSIVMAEVLSPPSDIDPQRTAQELRSQLEEALTSKGVIP